MVTTDGDHGPVHVTETHSAIVLLVGDRAYKWKKPVAFGFLDFHEREQRAAACRRELELNRRLAPDVYLDVATLVGFDGAPIEDVLIMRRLAGDRRLSARVENNVPVEDCLRQVARAMASLHARTVTPEAIEPASLPAVRGNWQDNLDTLRGFAGQMLDEAEVEQVGDLAFAYLQGRSALFKARAERACDGHGDLLADDIFCLDDGPRIIDCLDFADHYRLGDPMLDVAFLAMDLERLGRRDLADRFLDWYREFSNDQAPGSLVHHFVAYRAHVRAKVSCLRAEQGVDAAAEAARRLHRLCLDRLREGQVALVLVGGLPGTGKSLVARGLAETHRWALLSSDEMRKEVMGLGRGVRAPDDAYTVEARTAVYRTLLDRAQRLMEHGESVVLDASWNEQAWREAAANTARETAGVCVAVRCEAPLDIARDRLRRRAERGGDASDATPEVLDRLAEQAEPWPEVIWLDTTGEPHTVVSRAADRVQARLRDG
jgi:aminoglycoside phosphotransferase family enzyme/predicted kinase